MVEDSDVSERACSMRGAGCGLGDIVSLCSGGGRRVTSRCTALRAASCDS